MDLIYHVRGLYREFFDSNPRRRTAYELGAENAQFVWNLLEKHRPLRILELGTGLSTVLIRTWIKVRQPASRVVSVDPSTQRGVEAGWDLLRVGLPAEHLYAWDVFTEWPQEDVADFILVNHGTAVDRMATLEMYEPLLASGGVLVFPDWNVRDFSVPMQQTLVEKGYRLMSHPESRDMRGRYIGVAHT